MLMHYVLYVPADIDNVGVPIIINQQKKKKITELLYVYFVYIDKNMKN